MKVAEAAFESYGKGEGRGAGEKKAGRHSRRRGNRPTRMEPKHDGQPPETR